MGVVWWGHTHIKACPNLTLSNPYGHLFLFRLVSTTIIPSIPVFIFSLFILTSFLLVFFGKKAVKIRHGQHVLVYRLVGVSLSDRLCIVCLVKCSLSSSERRASDQFGQLARDHLAALSDRLAGMIWVPPRDYLIKGLVPIQPHWNPGAHTAVN